MLVTGLLKKLKQNLKKSIQKKTQQAFNAWTAILDLLKKMI
jgi:hypothetical protein